MQHAINFEGMGMRYQRGLRALFSFAIFAGCMAFSQESYAIVYTTTTEYDDLRRPVKIIEPDNSYVKNIYVDGRLIYKEKYSTTGALVQKTKTDYTATGQVYKTYGPECFDYGVSNPPVNVALPGCNVTTNGYDDADQLAMTTDGIGINSKTEYYADGQVHKIIKAFGTLETYSSGASLQQDYATYTYTTNGKQASVVDANGNKTEYFYDGFDRLDKMQLPSKTTAGQSNTADYEEYKYDNNGNITGKRTRRGDWILNAFDNLNRQIRELLQTGGSFSALGVTCGSSALETCTTYDDVGKTTLIKYANNSYSISNIYDSAGRLWKSTDNSRLVEYAYDANNNRTMVKWPDGYYADYAYDNMNRVTTVKENGSATLATYGYDTSGRRASITLGNGAVTSYTYHDDDLLNTLNHNMAGTSNDVIWTYGFSNINQMVLQTMNNAAYTWTSGADKTDAYVVNGLNQYTSVAENSISYDNSGNLTGDGTWTYAYDVENMLVSASKSGTSATYAYDPMGRRSLKTVNSVTTTFLNDGVEEIADYSGSTLLSRYVHGPGVDEYLVMYTGAGTTNKRYFHANHQGSIVAMSDTSGNMADRFTYDSYGNVDDATGVPFKYTGRRLDDETGLYYYRARYYSSDIGRFLQTDPIGYGDGLNWYAYVGNSPMLRNDPSGRYVDLAIEFVSITVGVNSLVDNLSSGNLGSAAVDAGGIITDTILAVVPGVPGAVGLGIAASRKIDAFQIISNSKRGRASEKRVLDDLGLEKNSSKVSTSEGNAIPDSLSGNKSTEIKDTKNVSLTKQIRIQTGAAKEAGRESVLITGTNTKVSGKAEDAFDEVIRREDLGPDGN